MEYAFTNLHIIPCMNTPEFSGGLISVDFVFEKMDQGTRQDHPDNCFPGCYL
jgi:hypothetical protein